MKKQSRSRNTRGARSSKSPIASYKPNGSITSIQSYGSNAVQNVRTASMSSSVGRMVNVSTPSRSTSSIMSRKKILASIDPKTSIFGTDFHNIPTSSLRKASHLASQPHAPSAFSASRALTTDGHKLHKQRGRTKVSSPIHVTHRDVSSLSGIQTLPVTKPRHDAHRTVLPAGVSSVKTPEGQSTSSPLSKFESIFSSIRSFTTAAATKGVSHLTGAMYPSLAHVNNSTCRQIAQRLFSSTPSTTTGDAVKPPLGQLYTKGQKIDGFTVETCQVYPILSLAVYTLRHDRSGAEYVHIERDDSDNAFCVGFRTMPRDDTGVAHILEHTVLCGSEKYPVRDPFFLLMRRSFATFMNAMTRPEATYYPFSTQNKQDYYNLLSVYLDAVFFPLLRPNDFSQEGHRIEPKESTTDATPKSGTVHDNEVEDGVEKPFQPPNKQAVVNVEGNQVDMAEGGEDPLLVMKIIEELKMDPHNMTKRDLEKVSEVLEQRLMDNLEHEDIYDGSDSEKTDHSEVVPQDKRMYHGKLSDAAYRAIELAEKEDQLRNEMESKQGQPDAATATNSDASSKPPLAQETKPPVVNGKDKPVTLKARKVPTDFEFKGVVFNEMKGDLSDPRSWFYQHLGANLHTTSIYKNNSGGDPLAIPNLQYEDLVEFHRAHYHPGNAVFMSYGDRPAVLAEVDAVINAKLDELKTISPERTTAAYGQVDVPPAITQDSAIELVKNQTRFPHPKAVIEAGPTASMDDPDRPYKVSMTWLCRDEPITDIFSPGMIDMKSVDLSQMESVYPYRGAYLEGAEVDAEVVGESGIISTADATVVDVGTIKHQSDLGKLAPDAWFKLEVDGEIERKKGLLEKKLQHNDGVPPHPYLVPNPDAPIPEDLQKQLDIIKNMSPEDIKGLNKCMEITCLSLLSYLVFDNPYSPLYTVLTNPSLGSSPAPTTGVDTYEYTPSFSMGFNGVKRGEVDYVTHQLYDALKTIAETGEGLDSGVISAMLHQTEISFRDANRKYGVNMLQRLITPFAHGENMQYNFQIVNLVPLIQHVVNTSGSLYFRALIKHHLLSNPHRLMYIMKPDPDYAKKLQQSEQKLLESKVKDLSDEDKLALADKAEELRLQQEQAPDASCLPSVTLSDIDPKVVQYQFKTIKAGGQVYLPIDPGAQDTETRIYTPTKFKSFHDIITTIEGEHDGKKKQPSLADNAKNIVDAFDDLPFDDDSLSGKHITPNLSRPVTFNIQPTNGIVVIRAIINDVSERLQPHQLSLLPFITTLFGRIGVDGRDYKAHSHLIEQNASQFSLNVMYDEIKNLDTGEYEPKLQCHIRGKALTRNVDNMCDLLVESLTKPDFTEHVYNLLCQYSGSLSSAIEEASTKYAMFDAQSRIPGNEGGVLHHLVYGLPHVHSVVGLFKKILEETNSVGELKQQQGLSQDDTATTSGTALKTLNSKQLPDGVVESPLMMRLANDIAEAMRCIVLGHVKDQYTYAVDPSQETLGALSNANYFTEPTVTSSPDEDVSQRKIPLPPRVDCTPFKQNPILSPKGGFDRILVTCDEESAKDSRVMKGVSSLINGVYTAQPVAYRPENSLIASYLYHSEAESFVPSELVTSRDLPTSPTKCDVTTLDGRPTASDMVITPKVVPLTEVRNKFNLNQKVMEIAPTGAVKATTSPSPSSTAAVPSTAKEWLTQQSREFAQKRPFNYIAAPIQVNSVVLCTPTVPHQHPDCPVLMVAAELLAELYLHTEIREKGGAYGRFCSQSRDGLLSMGSMRDPHIDRTIKVFEKAIEWIKDKKNISQQSLDEAKISLFSSIDSPESPSNRGIYQYLRNASPEERQVFRDRLLNCTVDDIVSAATKHMSFNKAKISVAGSMEAMPQNIDEDARTPNGKWSITVMGQ